MSTETKDNAINLVGEMIAERDARIAELNQQLIAERQSRLDYAPLDAARRAGHKVTAFVETGEVRPPKHGEHFVYRKTNFVIAEFEYPDQHQFWCPILRRLDFEPLSAGEAKLVPVFAKTVDGKPLSDEESKSLTEYVNTLPDNPPLTLRSLRMITGHGLRGFAERIGLLPSRYLNIENGNDKPTDEEFQAIVRGLACQAEPAAQPERVGEGKRYNPRMVENLLAKHESHKRHIVNLQAKLTARNAEINRLQIEQGQQRSRISELEHDVSRWHGLGTASGQAIDAQRARIAELEGELATVRRSHEFAEKYRAEFIKMARSDGFPKGDPHWGDICVVLDAKMRKQAATLTRAQQENERLRGAIQDHQKAVERVGPVWDRDLHLYRVLEPAPSDEQGAEQEKWPQWFQPTDRCEHGPILIRCDDKNQCFWVYADGRTSISTSNFTGFKSSAGFDSITAAEAEALKKGTDDGKQSTTADTEGSAEAERSQPAATAEEVPKLLPEVRGAPATSSDAERDLSPVRSEGVAIEESRGCIKLPTNTNQNQLADRYLRSLKRDVHSSPLQAELAALRQQLAERDAEIAETKEKLTKAEAGRVEWERLCSRATILLAERDERIAALKPDAERMRAVDREGMEIRSVGLGWRAGFRGTRTWTLTHPTAAAAIDDLLGKLAQQAAPPRVQGKDVGM